MDAPTGRRPLAAAATVAAAPCLIIAAAMVLRSTPWGLDGWLLLQVAIFVSVAVASAKVARSVQVSSGASAVVAGWSVGRILVGMLVVTLLLGGFRLVESGVASASEDFSPTVRPDRYAMIIEGIWILWCLFGAAVVVEQDTAIREKERPVVEAKVADRQRSFRVDGVRSMVEGIRGANAEQRSMLDGIRRDLQTAELALAHSHGGGLGTIERPRDSSQHEAGAIAVEEMLLDVRSLAEQLSAGAHPEDEQLMEMRAMVKRLVVAAEAMEAV